MSINIAYSSEMMSQYLQGETIGPGHKFEALQSPEGHSLLFSIGTNGVFYLTEEQPQTSTGWQQNDLSSALQTQFSSPLQAKDFAVAQLPNGEGFGLLLVITVNQADFLYYSNQYTRSEEDNSINLIWQALPFDSSNPPAALSIAQVYYANTNQQAVGVVDVQGEQDGDIQRYYIDPEKEASKQYWNPYLLPYDMDASEATYLCDGRKTGAKINGLYTLGTVGSVPIVVFQEFFDYYSGGAAPSTRLLLPNGMAAQNLASFESVDSPADKEGSFTDLVVTGADGGLYYFPADQQQDQQEGLLLFQNDLLKEINTLQAFKTEDKVVVWGLNRAQQVFYTQVALAEVATGSQWSLPLAIGSGVEQISPYVNVVNGGNTYFAHTGNGQLKKAFQDPVSTLWTKQDIVVPALPDSSAQKFDAYTTKITLTDESNLPITGVTVQVSSAYRIPVYINYHYYILDTAPIAIPVDAQGSLYILQKTESLQAALLTFQSPEGQVLTVNPMDKVAEQYFTLTTPEALQAATVTDDKGENPQPLLPADTSEEDVQNTAAAMQSLSEAYDSLNGSSASTASFVVRPKNNLQLGVISSIGDTMEDFANAVVVAAGDLLDCLESATEYVIHIVQDVATATWNFVCEIGGAVLTFVIDTIEKVIGALQAILQALATAVKLAIQFIKFLFSWGDIQLTKDVMKNMLMVTLQGALNSVDLLEQEVDGVINKLIAELDDWANLSSDDSNSVDLEDMAAKSNTSGANAASSNFLQYYFSNNAAASTLTMPSPSQNSPAFDQTLQNLQASIQQWINQQQQEEVQPIQDALDTFYNSILKEEQYKSMSIAELLQKTIAIFLEAILGIAEKLFNAVLELVKEIASTVLQLLDTPIWIPVLSDILEEFFDTELSFSVLDVLLLVVALPATLGYKIMAGKAPFEEGDAYTNTLLHCTDFQTLYQTVTGQSLPNNSSMLVLATTSNNPNLDKQAVLFILGRLATSVTSLLAGLLVIPSALAPKSKVLSIINIILNVVAVGVNALVNILAQPAVLINEFCNKLYYLLILLNILLKLLVVHSIFGKSVNGMKIEEIKLMNDVGTFVIKGINLVTVIMHIYELIRDFENYPNQAVLALAECGVDITDFLNKGTELVMAFTPTKAGVEVEAVEVGIDVGLYALQTVLQLGQSLYADGVMLVGSLEE